MYRELGPLLQANAVFCNLLVAFTEYSFTQLCHFIFKIFRSAQVNQRVKPEEDKTKSKEDTLKKNNNSTSGYDGQHKG